MENNIIKKDEATQLQTDVTNFELYLENLGLPSENIVASVQERKNIETNLPNYINSLSPEVKKDARYLSKFVAGAAIGLFDASLNYIWNEVIINLRNKITIYGIDMFFDAAVGGARRALYVSEDDLSGIKDEVLVNTCMKLELISEIVSKKLHHIQTMRNDIGASHPNTYSINAFELMGWLQTCVQEVLADEPSEAAIQIKSFVVNLKQSSSVIDATTIKSMEKPISDLSQGNTDNLLNSIFGIYVADSTTNIVRKNISLLAKFIWDNSSEHIKNKLGLQIDGYRNNLHEEKNKFGKELFAICDGNSFMSLDSKIHEIDELVSGLLNARYNWDNYYNEPPFIQKIITYFKNENDIPAQILNKLINATLICRIGKGISFENGVSPQGKKYYDIIFGLFGDDNIILTIIEMHSRSIRIDLDNKYCMENMVEILQILKNNARSAKVIEIVDYLITNKDKLSRIHNIKEYQALAKSHILWK